MIRRTTLLATALASAAVLGLSSCGSDSASVASDCQPAHEFSTLKKGKLIVGVQELPPFLSTKGGLSGVEGDIINRIAKTECLEIEPVSPSTAAMVPSVQQGRVDVVIGNWYRNEARTSILNFTDPIYVDDVGAGSDDGVNTFTDMKGRRVGILDGSLYQGQLTELFGDDLKLYPSDTNARQDLQADRIDVWLGSYGALQYAAKSDQSLKVEKVQPDPAVSASTVPPQIGFMLPLDNEAMLEAFNADIAQLHQDGTIEGILSDNGLDPASADVGEPRLIQD